MGSDEKPLPKPLKLMPPPLSIDELYPGRWVLANASEPDIGLFPMCVTAVHHETELIDYVWMATSGATARDRTSSLGLKFYALPPLEEYLTYRPGIGVRNVLNFVLKHWSAFKRIDAAVVTERRAQAVKHEDELKAHTQKHEQEFKAKQKQYYQQTVAARDKADAALAVVKAELAAATVKATQQQEVLQARISELERMVSNPVIARHMQHTSITESVDVFETIRTLASTCNIQASQLVAQIGRPRAFCCRLLYATWAVVQRTLAQYFEEQTDHAMARTQLCRVFPKLSGANPAYFDLREPFFTPQVVTECIASATAATSDALGSSDDADRAGIEELLRNHMIELCVMVALRHPSLRFEDAIAPKSYPLFKPELHAAHSDGDDGDPASQQVVTQQTWPAMLRGKGVFRRGEVTTKWVPKPSAPQKPANAFTATLQRKARDPQTHASAAGVQAPPSLSHTPAVPKSSSLLHTPAANDAKGQPFRTTGTTDTAAALATAERDDHGRVMALPPSASARPGSSSGGLLPPIPSTVSSSSPTLKRAIPKANGTIGNDESGHSKTRAMINDEPVGDVLGSFHSGSSGSGNPSSFASQRAVQSQHHQHHQHHQHAQPPPHTTANLSYQQQHHSLGPDLLERDQAMRSAGLPGAHSNHSTPRQENVQVADNFFC